MSSDDGVYIGKFPTNGGFEWRVCYAQNIEDTEDFLYDGSTNEYVNCYIVLNYNKSIVYSTEEEAYKAADFLYKEHEDDWCIIEYGICRIDYPRPYPKMTAEEAKETLDIYCKKCQFEWEKEWNNT